MSRIRPDQVLILKNSEEIQDCTTFNHCLKTAYKDITKEIHHKGSFLETCDEIGKLISTSKPTQEGVRTIKFFPRILMIGARGSGSRTQAKLLCKRFGFVFGE